MTWRYVALSPPHFCIYLLPIVLWYRVVMFSAMRARDNRRFIGRAYVHIAGQCVVQDVCVDM